MLDGMRRLSQGLFGRAIMTGLFGLLIASFAIWGIGDMFRGFVCDKLADVGSAVDHAQRVPERAADDADSGPVADAHRPDQRPGACARASTSRCLAA